MPNKGLNVIIYLLLIISLAGCYGDRAEDFPGVQNTSDISSPLQRNEYLVVTTIAKSYKYEINIMKPFADYLAKALSEYGIKAVKVLPVKSLDKLQGIARKDKIDIYFDSVLPTLFICKYSGFKPILQQWKNCCESYRSVIFTSSNSPANSITDLKGKTIAFENSYSTTGFFIPRLILAENNISLSRFYSNKHQKSYKNANYVFSEDDESTLFWVLNHKVDAGCTDDMSFKEIAGIRRDELKILYTSEEIPRQYVSVSESLPDDLISALTDVLLNMDKTEEGRIILESYYRTRKFTDYNKKEFANLVQSYNQFLGVY